MPRTTLPTLAACAVIASARLLAQQPGDAATLEVASIRQNTSGDGNSGLNIRPGGIVAATNLPVSSLITAAYRLQASQLIGGPAWIRTERYDVLAKSSSGVMSREVIGPLLRAILADRFKLVVHNDMRELPVYALIRAQPGGALGPRMQTSPVGCNNLANGPQQPNAPPDPAPGRARCSMSTGQRGPGQLRIAGSGVDMPMLANTLGTFLGRLVVDKSGVSGWYDLEVEFLSDRAPAGVEGVPLVTALQEQLGLKAENDRAPVEVVVVDSIERPTEN